MVKQFLAGLTVAIAGNLGDGWSADKVGGWVRHRGGRFVPEVDKTVTHLICSAAEYRQKGPQVKEALSNGKSCQIVTRDWLEDSITMKRKLREKQFLHRLLHQKDHKKKIAAKKTAKNAEEAERFVNRNLYHIFQDSTFFPYEVVITRDDAAADIVGERYILSLFESNAKPHLYWFAAKHYKSKTNTKASVLRPSNIPQVKEKELQSFKDFFLLKTGVEWNNRLDEIAEDGQRLFFYEPPKGGKPVGELEGEVALARDAPEAEAGENTAEESDVVASVLAAIVSGDDEVVAEEQVALELVAEEQVTEEQSS